MHTLKVDSPSTLSTVAHQRKCHLSCSCLIHSGKMAGIFNDKTLSLMLKVGTSSRFFSRMPSCTVNPKKPCIIIMEIVVEWTVMGCLSAKKPQIGPVTLHQCFLCHIFKSVLHVLSSQDGQSRTVRQFQFTDWPEQGVPKSGEGFIDFIGQVHKTKEQFGQDGPISVHCRWVTYQHNPQTIITCIL